MDEYYEMDEAELKAYREQIAFEDYQASLAEEMHERIQNAKKVVSSYPHDQVWSDANEFLSRYAEDEETINPWILTGNELERTVRARIAGR